MNLDIVTLLVLVAASVWTVMTRSILRAAIGLALVSIIITMLMFKLNSPLAAVFELSVCVGLISVLFVSTISLTQPYTSQEVLQRMKDMFARFKFLPLIVIVLGLGLSFVKFQPMLALPAAEPISDVRIVLWNLRRMDMIGQILILLAGAFGVVTLFKERQKK